MKIIDLDELKLFPICTDPLTGKNNETGKVECKPLPEKWKGTVLDLIRETEHETAYLVSAFMDWLSIDEKVTFIQYVFNNATIIDNNQILQALNEMSLKKFPPLGGFPREVDAIYNFINAPTKESYRAVLLYAQDKIGDDSMMTQLFLDCFNNAPDGA